MKTIKTSKGEFVFIPVPKEANTDVYPKIGIVDAYWPTKGKEYNEDNYLSAPIPKGDHETIGYCSEIIKDEELAKSIIDKSIHSGLYSDYIGCIKMYNKQKPTYSFESLLQANDIDLNEQD